MKYIKLLSVLVPLISVILIQSCGDDEGGDESICVDDIFGAWEVTNFVPSSSNCTLTTYEFRTGTASNILAMSIVDESRTFTGNGLLDADCSEMTYTVSQGGTIVSGSIRFNGAMLEDRSDFGCLVSATKQ